MSYKIIKIHMGGGNVDWGFVGADGKARRFPIVGRVWRIRPEGILPGPFKWQAVLTVIQTPEGLEMLESHRSKITKPFKLADGEVYLPLSATGRALALVDLPAVPAEAGK